MNDSDLLRLADLNRMEYWRESLNWIPGTEVFEDQDAVFINSVVDFPACNIVLTRSQGTAEVISRAQQFFSQRKRSFALLLRNHGDQDAIKFCRESKMLMISDNAGMALEQPVNKKKLRDGAELHWVEDAKGLEGFEQVTAEAYQDLGLPAAITHKYFALADRVLSPYSIWAVVYYQDEPAAAAMAILSHGIAGIYWVACAKKSRGLGLAAYCTQEVGNAAFDLGARKVILQASQFGDPVYRKLGYREITRYPWFICSVKQALK
ncbi:MAG: GNAT family N-acetyltransferase [Dehalococcoidia bacterium]